MHYWLFKSEPSCYSIDDLAREREGTWDGVRNFQARNFLRDTIHRGDMVLFYHSNTDPVGIVGIAQVKSGGYPDDTQFDSKSTGHDKTARTENPRWYVVDITFVEKFTLPLTLHELKNDPFFSDMLVVQKGMRLSIQPVHKKHFQKICSLRSTCSKK